MPISMPIFYVKMATAVPPAGSRAFQAVNPSPQRLAGSIYVFLGHHLPLTVAEDPKTRRGSWFRRAAAAGQADPGGVFIDAAHGVGGPKMEALAKVGGG